MSDNTDAECSVNPPGQDELAPTHTMECSDNQNDSVEVDDEISLSSPARDLPSSTSLITDDGTVPIAGYSAEDALRELDQVESDNIILEEDISNDANPDEFRTTMIEDDSGSLEISALDSTDGDISLEISDNIPDIETEPVSENELVSEEGMAELVMEDDVEEEDKDDVVEEDKDDVDVEMDLVTEAITPPSSVAPCGSSSVRDEESTKVDEDVVQIFPGDHIVTSSPNLLTVPDSHFTYFDLPEPTIHPDSPPNAASPDILPSSCQLQDVSQDVSQDEEHKIPDPSGSISPLDITKSVFGSCVPEEVTKSLEIIEEDTVVSVSEPLPVAPDPIAAATVAPLPVASPPPVTSTPTPPAPSTSSEKPSSSKKRKLPSKPFEPGIIWIKPEPQDPDEPGIILPPPPSSSTAVQQLGYPSPDPHSQSLSRKRRMVGGVSGGPPNITAAPTQSQSVAQSLQSQSVAQSLQSQLQKILQTSSGGSVLCSLLSQLPGNLTSTLLNKVIQQQGQAQQQSPQQHHQSPQQHHHSPQQQHQSPQQQHSPIRTSQQPVLGQHLGQQSGLALAQRYIPHVTTVPRNLSPRQHQQVGGNQQPLLGNQHFSGSQNISGNQMLGNQQQLGSNQQQLLGNQQQLGSNQQQLLGNQQQLSSNQQQLLGNQQHLVSRQQTPNIQPSHSQLDTVQLNNLLRKQYQSTAMYQDPLQRTQQLLNLSSQIQSLIQNPQGSSQMNVSPSNASRSGPSNMTRPVPSNVQTVNTQFQSSNGNSQLYLFRARRSTEDCTSLTDPALQSPTEEGDTCYSRGRYSG